MPDRIGDYELLAGHYGGLGRPDHLRFVVKNTVNEDVAQFVSSLYVHDRDVWCQGLNYRNFFARAPRIQDQPVGASGRTSHVGADKAIERNERYPHFSSQEPRDHRKVVVVLDEERAGFDRCAAAERDAKALNVDGSTDAAAHGPGADKQVGVEGEIAANESEILSVVSNDLVRDGQGATRDVLPPDADYGAIGEKRSDCVGDAHHLRPLETTLAADRVCG